MPDAHPDTPVHLRAAGVSVVLVTRRGASARGAALGRRPRRAGRRRPRWRSRRPPCPAPCPTTSTTSPAIGVLPEHARGLGRPAGARRAARRAGLVAAVHAHRLRRAARSCAAAGPCAPPAATTRPGWRCGWRSSCSRLGCCASGRRSAVPAGGGGGEPFVVDGLAARAPGAAGGHRAVRPRRAAGAASGRRSVRRSSSGCTRGRTGAAAPARTRPLVLAAGTAGFGFRDGEVWAVHVAWSGNHVSYAERLANGAAVLGGGELLLPGEIRLAPGEEYTGPVDLRRARPRASTGSPPASTRTCAPARSTRARRARSC